MGDLQEPFTQISSTSPSRSLEVVYPLDPVYSQELYVNSNESTKSSS